MRAASVFVFSLAILLAGCANLTVTKVEPSSAAGGLRYSLPKPFIQVVPQPDGTIAVEVVYLPDIDNTYAISTSAYFAAYAFQVVLEQGGFLSKIELRQNTAAVSQQAAATGGAMTAQALSLQAAQATAVQGVVDTAQAAVDEARATVMANEKKLELLERQTPRPTDLINNTRVALEEAKAKLTVKEDALRRAQTNARSIAIQAAAGTPIATSAPSFDSRLAPPAWSAPTIHSIAGDKGAVLFAVNEGVADGKPFVRLQAVKLNGVAQPQFRTTRVAATPPPDSTKPQLQPKDQSFPSSGQAEFTFTAAITRLTGQRLELAPQQEGAQPSVVENAPKAVYDSATRKVTLPLGGLAKQRYKLSLFYDYLEAGAEKKGDAFLLFFVR
jgi:hypothetical protein